MGSASRRTVRGIAALTVLLVLIVPGIAWAHAHLTKSSPAANARLATAPDHIQLWFSEAPELPFTKITLLRADSSRVMLSRVSRAGDDRLSVSDVVMEALAPGRYTLLWQTAAADGHPSHGQFTFTVLTPPAAGSPAVTLTPSTTTTGMPSPAPRTAHEVQGTPPARAAFGPNAPAYVIDRWVSFTALLILLGVIAFQQLVLGTLRRAGAADGLELARMASTRTARLGIGAAVVLVLAALARLYLQALVMQSAGDAMDGGLVAAIVWHTMWGWSWLLQVVVTVIALAAFVRAAREEHHRRTAARMIAGVAVLVLAFTPALGGHAVASPRLTTLAVLADGVHVIGAGGWLGGLLLVVAIGIPTTLRLAPSERGPAVAALVNAFSPTALTFAGIVAASGVFAAWLHLEHVSALWQSPYGRTLLIKLAVVVLLAGSGAYNWLRVRPALGEARGTRRMQRSATFELLVGVVVIAITAVLVALPTPLDVTAITP